MGLGANLVESVTATVRESWYRMTGRAELAEVLHAERASRLFLQETLSDLEARMAEPGWQRLTALAEREFTREGLQQITAVCRVIALKNPLVKRALSVRSAYVWGQGVEISARSTGDADGGEQDVNAVIQAFLDDESNRRTFTSGQARNTNEHALGTDGNVFLALFTSPRTGRVQVRTVPWDEIVDVLNNPDDASDPQYYKREWWSERVDPISGGIITERRVAYYPALGYRPAARPVRIKGVDSTVAEVMWDAPIVHVKVGGQLGWKFGVPDAYAAVDWAVAYKEFLTDWAKLVKALSLFAWRLTNKGKGKPATARVGRSLETDPTTGKPLESGATAMLRGDAVLEAVPKTGATIDSESGRPLAMMVAAGTDVPVTMLLGDPGLTGARAVAETLDRPFELVMGQRRELWTDVLRTILNYVVDQAVKAPQGPLTGKVVRDADGRETVELDGDTDRTVDVSWPELNDIPVETLVKAIVDADSTGYMPPLQIVRLLLEALGVRSVDEILAELTDEQGNFKPPAGVVAKAALDAFRRGQDPAAQLAGDVEDEPPDVQPGDDPA